MTTRCKFKCDSVTAFSESAFTVSLTAVTNGSEENKSFWKYTPSGKLEFNCINENVKFIPGKEYYLDVTEAAQ